MRKLYIGAALTSLQPILLSALMLPATGYVIRELGPTQWGQFSAATALVALTTFATNLGLRAAFVRAVARHPASAGHTFAVQLGIRLCLSVIAGLVAVIVSLALGYSALVTSCTAISAVALILTTAAATAGDLLQGLQRLPTVAAANMVSGLVLTAASVAAVVGGLGPVAVAVAYVVGPAASVVMMFWIIGRRHFPVRVEIDWAKFRGLLWEARFLGASQLVHSASTNAEALFLPRLVGETAFGYFSGGSLLATRLTAVPDGLATALYPAVVEAERQSPRAVVRLVLRFVVLALLSCLGAAVIIMLLSGPIANILFKGEPEIGAGVMRITIWLLPVMGVLWVLGAALNGLNGDAAQARAAVISSVLNLALTAVLVAKFGLTGACWSMVLRYVVWLLVFLPCAWSVFKPVLRAAASQPGTPDPVAR